MGRERASDGIGAPDGAEERTREAPTGDRVRARRFVEASAALYASRAIRPPPRPTRAAGSDGR